MAHPRLRPAAAQISSLAACQTTSAALTQASPFDAGASSLANFALTIAILIVRATPYRIAGRRNFSFAHFEAVASLELRRSVRFA